MSKTYTVVWSNKATSSLQAIHNFIQNDSPQGAKKVVRELVKLAQSLQTFPLRFPIEPLLAEEAIEYRFVTKWSYKIIYTVEENQILIVNIFDTRQSPSKLNV